MEPKNWQAFREELKEGNPSKCQVIFQEGGEDSSSVRLISLARGCRGPGRASLLGKSFQASTKDAARSGSQGPWDFSRKSF